MSSFSFWIITHWRLDIVLVNKKKRTCQLVDSVFPGLVYLFNGISTPHGLFKIEIWFIHKCLNTIITIYIFNVPLHTFFTPHFYFSNDSMFVSSIPIYYKKCVFNYIVSQYDCIQYIIVCNCIKMYNCIIVNIIVSQYCVRCKSNNCQTTLFETRIDILTGTTTQG